MSRWFFLILIGMAGCTPIPTSLNPVTDDTNSEVYPRLIGIWILYDQAEDSNSDSDSLSNLRKPPYAKQSPSWVILLSHHEKFERRMKCTVFLIDKSKSGTNETEMDSSMDSGFLYAVQGKYNYLSIPEQSSEKVTKEKKYSIYRYEFLGDTQMRVHLLNNRYLVDAVEKGLLAGKVHYRPARARKPGAQENQLSSTEKEASVFITAGSQAFRKFLDKNPEAFSSDGLVFRKFTNQDLLNAWYPADPPSVPKPPLDYKNVWAGVFLGVLSTLAVLAVLRFMFTGKKQSPTTIEENNS